MYQNWHWSTYVLIHCIVVASVGAEFVLQPSPGVCRDISRTKVARKKEAIAYFSMESALALFISLFINLCVVSVFAKGFYGKGAGDIGLKNAGDYLGERFGSHMVRDIPVPCWVRSQCLTFVSACNV
jgi:hypothetical protein